MRKNATSEMSSKTPATMMTYSNVPWPRVFGEGHVGASIVCFSRLFCGQERFMAGFTDFYVRTRVLSMNVNMEMNTTVAPIIMTYSMAVCARRACLLG